VPPLEILAHRVAFACIWTSLALYTVDLLSGLRRAAEVPGPSSRG
jgi:EamA domain-containing membrane protein RarD